MQGRFANVNEEAGRALLKGDIKENKPLSPQGPGRVLQGPGTTVQRLRLLGSTGRSAGWRGGRDGTSNGGQVTRTLSSTVRNWLSLW